MAKVLSEISEALASTVESAGKSVVRVEGRSRLAASGFAWSAGGVVVTAHHVLERDDNITIGLPNGETASATLAGRDPSTDLAALRVSTSELTAPALAEPGEVRVGNLALAEPGEVRVGNLALALGRPGQTVQATLGVVSALGKGWRTPAGGQVDRYLQNDAVMYPGFSGGPLVDASGRVLGLNTSALLRGVNVSIPVPTVRRVVETLLAHGRVRRGYLGVGMQVARLPDTLSKQLDQETGLLIVSVESGSPAEQGGLMMGDTIVALNSQPVHHLDDLMALLVADTVGTTAPVRIIRGGQVQEVSVLVGARS